LRQYQDQQQDLALIENQMRIYAKQSFDNNIFSFNIQSDIPQNVYK